MSRSSRQIRCQDRCTEEPGHTPTYCIWGSSTALLYSRFSKPAPMFLDDSFRKWARIREFVPPFGIKGQGTLGTLAHSTLTSHPSACLPALRIGLYPQKSPCWGSTPLLPFFPSFLFLASLFVYSEPTTWPGPGIQQWNGQYHPSP